MADPSSELHRAMRALVGHRVTVVSTRPPGYQSLRELYGSNASIASAAGYETAAQARRAGRDAAVARRKRQTFLRNLQRYANGSRRPQRLKPLLDRLEDEEVRRRETFTSLVDLARGFRDDGVTVVHGASMTVMVSSDERERDRLPSVAFRASERFVEAVERDDWTVAAAEFFDSWGLAYGIGYVSVEDVQILELEVGMRAGAYQVRRSA